MADPISLAKLASSVFEFAKWIAARSGTFYANQKSSKRFGDRLAIAEPSLRKIAEKANPNDAERVFVESCYQLAEDAQSFLGQFEGGGKSDLMSKARKFVFADSDKEKFAEMNQRLNQISLDLSLNLNAEAWAAEDAADAGADAAQLQAATRDLVEQVGAMKEQQGQHHAELLGVIAELRESIDGGGDGQRFGSVHEIQAGIAAASSGFSQSRL